MFTSCSNTKKNHYHSLFIPLLKVSNLIINYFSLSFLYSSSFVFVCSNIVTLRSARLWQGRFQWAPVALLVAWLMMLPLCSSTQNLIGALLFQYRCLHCSIGYSNMYTVLNVWQVNILLSVQCEKRTLIGRILSNI